MVSCKAIRRGGASCGSPQACAIAGGLVVQEGPHDNAYAADRSNAPRLPGCDDAGCAMKPFRPPFSLASLQVFIAVARPGELARP